MATLYLMVGLPCSGKTTRAKELENEVFALRPTPGEWHVNLFGHDIHDPDHNKRHGLIEDMLWQIAARALSLGTNIILDFGFWAKEERDDFRLRAGRLGARSQIKMNCCQERKIEEFTFMWSMQWVEGDLSLAGDEIKSVREQRRTDLRGASARDAETPVHADVGRLRSCPYRVGGESSAGVRGRRDGPSGGKVMGVTIYSCT